MGPLWRRAAGSAAAAASRALVVGEVERGTLAAASLAAVSAARQAVGDAGEVEVLVAGRAEGGGAAEAAARVAGVSRVLVADAPGLHRGMPEAAAEAVLARHAAAPYSHLMAGASTFGKNLMPRIAAQLDVGQVSDVVAVDGPSKYTRPIYAGNALASVMSLDTVQVVTVRPTAFEAPGDAEAAAETETLDFTEATPARSRWLAEERTESNRPELGAARVVVSGGRGLKSGDHFGMLEQLADKLGGAVGATRAAVDDGMCPNDMQVGQTGKVVAPDLYIAVGLSGAVQHLAGMKDSKVIVAINKDPDAPIFQVADYGLVGDLFTVMPELLEALD